MNFLIQSLIVVFSSSAFAAADGFVSMHPGMVRADKGVALETNLKAEFACDLYKFRTEKGNLRESTYLTSQKLGTTQVGKYLAGAIRFPAPFSHIEVGFDHAMVSYAETDDGLLPYLQAYFLINGHADTDHFGSQADLRFDIKDIKPESKLILRGYYPASDEALLTFRCSMRFTE